MDTPPPRSAPYPRWVPAVAMVVIHLLIWRLWFMDVYADVQLVQYGEMNLLDVTFYPSIREIFFKTYWGRSHYRVAIWWRLAIATVGLLWTFWGHAHTLRRVVLVATSAVFIWAFLRTSMALGTDLFGGFNLSFIGRWTDLIWRGELIAGASLVVVWLLASTHKPPAPRRFGSWTAVFAIIPVMTATASVLLRHRHIPFVTNSDAQLREVLKTIPSFLFLGSVVVLLLVVGGMAHKLAAKHVRTALAAFVLLGFAGTIVSAMIGYLPEAIPLLHQVPLAIGHGLIIGALAASILHEALLQLPGREPKQASD